MPIYAALASWWVLAAVKVTFVTFSPEGDIFGYFNMFGDYLSGFLAPGQQVLQVDSAHFREGCLLKWHRFATRLSGSGLGGNQLATLSQPLLKDGAVSPFFFQLCNHVSCHTWGDSWRPSSRFCR